LQSLLQLPFDLLASARHRRAYGVRAVAQTFRDMRDLRRQGAMDKTYYRSQLGDSAEVVNDVVLHYVLFGADEGLDPAPGFSTAFYKSAHPDVAAAGLNPLAHYLRYGAQENRRIEPSGSVSGYTGADTGSDGVLDEANRLALAGRHAAEEGAVHAWPMRDRAHESQSFGLYDWRPADIVVAEAADGHTFLSQFGLLGDAPNFAGAVDALNALGWTRNSEVDATIVIPVYGQLAYTLNALHSLFQHESRYRFEIIVGDDGSPDDSGLFLPNVKEVAYVRHAVNGGFIENCNATARLGSGRYLVFLNNDIRVCPGWLDGLLDSFGNFPKAGLVGSQLLYPDGALQEAGGIVWRDGGAWNYGRNDDPNRPRYNYAAPCDYVSAASVAIGRALWETLGGFDIDYKPAYYEDTDLAFRVRKAGYEVVYQPVSKAIHYEGKTSGTDTASGVKSRQKVNQITFFNRWKDSLRTHRSMGDRPRLERDRRVHKRALIVDACNPGLGSDAGSQATINLIQAYQALGYQVSFVPEDNFLYERESVTYLQSIGVECFYAPYETSIVRILQCYGHLYDVVQLIRPQVAQRVIDAVKRLAPRARILFLNADLHFLRMERQAALEKNEDLRAQAESMKAVELKLVEAVDVTMVHSTYEQNLLDVLAPASHVVLTPLIEAVTEGVADHDARVDVAFLGGFNHPPNLDAALWLADEIWPSLQDVLPKARLLLIGSNPPPALRERQSERVIVTGRVESLPEWFETVRVFVAPLRYGAGAKGKIVVAMANGVPVVATRVAAEGMGLEANNTIFLAEDKAAMIREISRLYQLPSKDWSKYSRAAQAHIRDNNSRAALVAAVHASLI